MRAGRAVLITSLLCLACGCHSECRGSYAAGGGACSASWLNCDGHSYAFRSASSSGDPCCSCVVDGDAGPSLPDAGFREGLCFTCDMNATVKAVCGWNAPLALPADCSANCRTDPACP